MRPLRRKITVGLLPNAIDNQIGIRSWPRPTATSTRSLYLTALPCRSPMSPPSRYHLPLVFLLPFLWHKKRPEFLFMLHTDNIRINHFYFDIYKVRQKWTVTILRHKSVLKLLLKTFRKTLLKIFQPFCGAFHKILDFSVLWWNFSAELYR